MKSVSTRLESVYPSPLSVDWSDWNIDRRIVLSSERQYQISPGSLSKNKGIVAFSSFTVFPDIRPPFNTNVFTPSAEASISSPCNNLLLISLLYSGVNFARSTAVRFGMNNSLNIQSEDRRAARTISEMLDYIEALKEYRKTLYARAQEICAAPYRLQLKIKRTVDRWKNKKFYTVTLSKIYEEKRGIRPEKLIDETYNGKDRAKALKRFDDLRKEYANVEAVKEIDKYQWEK